MPRQPPRSKVNDDDSTDGSAMSKPKGKTKGTTGAKRKTPSGARSMPPPLPLGEVLTDLNKKQWKLGTSVGKGGFGEIYTATPSSTTKSKTAKAPQYVIKVEPHENGPLFTELSFYRRSAKQESISEWVSSHELKYLGIPPFIGSGLHESSIKTQYRFMVMERFGDDIEKLFCQAGRLFNIKTVCYLALRLIEALEYLHESEYVHADIKGSNLLTGFTPDTRHQVYLVDYGLAYRYGPQDEHRDYKPDPRRCHDGTIEFTSIDAHNGANPSRRGDMEILGYCLLQWACGRLPWESLLEDKPKVAAVKTKYKSLPVLNLMKDCFKGKPIPSCLSTYMQQVYKLSYKDKPLYDSMKDLFLKELKDRKLKDDKEGLEWMRGKHSPQKCSPQKRMVLEINPVEIETDSPLSPPPLKRRKITTTNAKTQRSPKEKPKSKESIKDDLKESTEDKTQQNKSTKKGQRAKVSKTTGDEQQREQSTQESKESTKESTKGVKRRPALAVVEENKEAKRPTRAAKLLAKERITHSITSLMESSFKETTDQASINKEEEKTDEEEEVHVNVVEVKNKRNMQRLKRKKSPPSGSDIIEEKEEMEKEETAQVRNDVVGRKRKKSPLPGSDIIPGLEKPKEKEVGKTTNLKIVAERKRKKSPPSGSNIIPGLEESKRKKIQEDTSNDDGTSDIISEVESANGHDNVIIPKGHYPQELGYTKQKLSTRSKKKK